eukprot:CAMPEP_0119152850 /NCGR_PEP_ID=MMETSP1310-20130426/48394_1 /TAXON_ID=464262 /ORGANISM="Genus nov. species nov., Strain RCC2339" /LENGTH=62 /DNA_ID=CAMNT_0007145255 /DNA_START=36 /DNA_END=221 /DNA_ORIENTATION=-
MKRRRGRLREFPLYGEREGEEGESEEKSGQRKLRKRRRVTYNIRKLEERAMAYGTEGSDDEE